MAPCGGFRQLGYHPNYTTNLSSIRPSPRYGPDDLDFGKTSKRADEGDSLPQKGRIIFPTIIFQLLNWNFGVVTDTHTIQQ